MTLVLIIAAVLIAAGLAILFRVRDHEQNLDEAEAHRLHRNNL